MSALSQKLFRRLGLIIARTLSVVLTELEAFRLRQFEY